MPGHLALASALNEHRIAVTEAMDNGDAPDLDGLLAAIDALTGAVVEAAETDHALRDARRRQEAALMIPARMTIDTTGWTRKVEVMEYAQARRCSISEAIRLLVNSGLSHR